jgi:hypothetical protein
MLNIRKKMILHKSSVKCKVINILDAKKKNKKTKTKLQNTSLSPFEKKIKKKYNFSTTTVNFFKKIIKL